MRRHGHESTALIETLHAAQAAYGYLDTDVLRAVAAALRVPPSQAYGVATFYHFFTLKPPGVHTCVVCMGTACYIKGAPALMAAVDAVAHVQPGETTQDGQVSLLTARCLGSCGLAPVAVFDGEVVGRVTPEPTRERIRTWLTDDTGRSAAPRGN